MNKENPYWKNHFKDYVIVGDTEEYKSCLIRICGESEEEANEVLNRMLTNPTEQDKEDLKKHTNVRIELAIDGWWHDPFLAN